MSEDVRIDRLVLDLPGLSVAEARRVAAAVGEGLSAAGEGHYGALSIELPYHLGEATPRLAERIVAQILRQIG
jgi:hypothetical protein